MGNKLKIKTLPTPVEGLYVTPVVTPEAVQGEKSSFPDLPDGSASEVTDLKAYLDKLEHYLTDLKSKLDNRVVKIELPEWDSNNPTTTGVQTKHIANEAITNAKILPYRLKEGTTDEYVGGLSGDRIKDGAINSAKIANGSIQGADIAGGTITRSNLNNGIFSPSLIGTTKSMSYGEVYDVSQYSFLLLCMGTEEEKSVNSSTVKSTRILATTLIPLLPNLSGEDSLFNVSHEACYRDINYLYAVQLYLYLDENKNKKCQLKINSKTAVADQVVPGFGDKGILFGIK